METWVAARGDAMGQIVQVQQLAALARRWYRGRLAPEWQPRSLEAAQALLESTGFTGPFWSFSGT